MRVELYIQGVKVKMFDKDETIKINRKVKDYRDIEKIFSDYSESFTLPGEANNALFKHYYDADVDGSFDARVKQPAQIYVDQELFKDGVIQLKNVQIKNKKVDNYKVQFFTQLTQLIETFGEDELNDLDFTAFNHPYTDSNVQFAFSTTNFIGGNIIYPLISYDKRFLYNQPVTDPNTQVDIFNNGFSWRLLRPAIKIKSIFEQIESFYALTFTGSIFSNIDFTELYMTLNNFNNLGLTSDATQTISVDEAEPPTIELVEVLINTFPDTGFENDEYKIQVTIDGETKAETDFITGDFTFIPAIQVDSNTFDINVNILSNSAFDCDVTTTALLTFSNNTTTQTSILNSSISVAPEVIISNLFTDFKVKDFVKAFVKAFNLVVIPLSETEILFEPLQDWYRDGRIIDLTPYTDNQDLEVKPGELISGIDFKFDKNETFLSAIFKENNNRGFGNLEQKFFDGNNEELEGDLLEVTLPFEKPIFEKIADNCIYGFYVNREREPFNPFHTIFYNKRLSGSPVKLIRDSGPQTYNNYNCPVTTQNAFGNLSTNFEIEINEFTSTNANITFYTKYYADYVNDLFSPKRRNYNMEARLPLQILRTINLNDRLLIGQRRYIINSYQADLMTQEVKLDIFNDIFSGDLSTEVDGQLLQRNFTTDYYADTIQFQLISQYDIDTAITGNGWTTVINGKLVSIEVPENNTGLTRVETVTIRDTESNSFEGFIIQTASNTLDTLIDTEGNTLIDTENNILTTYK